MSLLAGDAIQSLFGSVLGAVLYEPAALELWARSSVRDPETGTFPYARQAERPVKVQRDACTDAQRRQDGYTAEDVRIMVLQHGVTVDAAIAQEDDGDIEQENGYLILLENGTPAVLNTDARIRYHGGNYHVMAIDQDPARVYWDCRCRLVKS